MRIITPMQRTGARVTFVALADAHKLGERAKIDALGLFTKIGVWAVPAQRDFSLVSGIDNLPDGQTRLTAWVRQRGKKAKAIGGAVITPHDLETPRAFFAQRLHVSLPSAGIYEVGISLGESNAPRSAFWQPVLVYLLPWPTPLVGAELTKALADPTSIKAARAVLECHECHRSFTFEIRLDPNSKIPRGSLPFPDDGVFVCPTCATVHHLKDLEGQLRSQFGISGKPAGAT